MSSWANIKREVWILLLLMLGLGIAVAVIALWPGGGAAQGPLAEQAKPVIKKPPGVVYELTLGRAAGAEWSQKRIATTRNRQRKFLGPFDEIPVTFTVDGLPAHELIRLRFELLVFEPWNGDGANWGRDLWDMRVVGGQPLIHTTFSNCGFFSDNNEQSFPDQYPWYPTHRGWTGAASRQSLGYTASWGGAERTYGVDSTYAFDITFPHSADTLKLRFTSQIKNHENKPYGFLSFKVETVERAAPATEAELAGWWKDLADEQPLKAYRAVWSLVARGDVAANHIKAQVSIPSPAIPLNIDQMQIWKHGSFAYDTPELRQRARAIHVLEAIGTSSSMAALKQVGYAGTPSGGPPTAWDR